MQLDRDIQLILVGAAVGLFSSLLTTLFHTWLSRREHRLRQEQDRKRELQQIHLATLNDVERFVDSSDSRVHSKKGCMINIAPIFFFIFFVLFFSIVGNTFTRAAATAVIVFVGFQYFVFLAKE